MATDKQRKLIRAVLDAWMYDNDLRFDARCAGVLADKAISAYEAHMPTDQFREVTEKVDEDVVEVGVKAMRAAPKGERPHERDWDAIEYFDDHFAMLKAVLQAIGYAEHVKENKAFGAMQRALLALADFEISTEFVTAIHMRLHSDPQYDTGLVEGVAKATIDEFKHRIVLAGEGKV